ncbi:hypothetical protein KAFR_0B06600 [Kazachstania africana CBS 2517]|uniref:Ribosomal RNA-processing protein 15 n=1 Tax=Kazachstania africana (strain ATCC 22294 / BCRC 22015 / CBS 2517 / CECT 1963 / NBRC 1671 / NRRL Y-8276) TaxID=1071382 RepID=H2ARF6_KAZAF|nr:hypothetical protein KAFR_0B06600 [Kazachstania africana CBS 2517]CCF56956.1 hypothetical protein KAFR_0B06600 [Kazachstania africana CBS 2517]
MSVKGRVSVTQRKRMRDNVVEKREEEDVASISSDEAVSNEEEVESAEDEADTADEESDDNFPRKKKSKMSKHDDGSADFSSAVNAILSSHLKAYNRKDPIMARNKKVIKASENDKLEAQAKKALQAEKKKRLNKARKVDIIPTVSDETNSGEQIREILEKEAKLRKIAQKGVVKLFNAILSTQVKTEKEVNENFHDIKNQNDRKQLVTEVSKEKFLDLVKAAAEDE